MYIQRLCRLFGYETYPRIWGALRIAHTGGNEHQICIHFFFLQAVGLFLVLSNERNRAAEQRSRENSKHKNKHHKVNTRILQNSMYFLWSMSAALLYIFTTCLLSVAVTFWIQHTHGDTQLGRLPFGDQFLNCKDLEFLFCSNVSFSFSEIGIKHETDGSEVDFFAGCLVSQPSSPHHYTVLH